MNNIKILFGNLKDPKKKAITQLILYAIFFIFVFILISSNKVEPNIQVNSDTNVNNYEYTCNIKNNGNIIKINGIYTSNSEIFKVNDNSEYKVDNGNIILISGIPVELLFDVADFRYNKIKEIIDNSEFVEKTTYKDNSEKTTCIISSEKYFDILSKQYMCEIDSCDNKNINIIVESDKYINSVLIDLSDLSENIYSIDISYFNINSVS